MSIDDKLKILVLDDDPVRLKWFKSKFKDQDIHLAENSTVFDVKCGLYAGTGWDTIFLDHDLQEFHHDPYKFEVTGYDVAQAIIDSAVKVNKIVVHTINLPAGNRMVALLSEAGYSVEAIPYYDFFLPTKEPTMTPKAFKVCDNFRTIRGFKTFETATDTARRIFEGRVGTSYKAFLKTIKQDDIEYFGKVPTIQELMSKYGIHVLEDK